MSRDKLQMSFTEEDVKAIQHAWTGKPCPVDQAFVAGLLRTAESLGYKIIPPVKEAHNVH